MKKLIRNLILTIVISVIILAGSPLFAYAYAESECERELKEQADSIAKYLSDSLLSCVVLSYFYSAKIRFCYFNEFYVIVYNSCRSNLQFFISGIDILAPPVLS